MTRILVVVDMQNDFIDGPLGTKEAQNILPAVYKKIEQAADAGDFVIFTRDTHFANYLSTQEGRLLPVPHCIKDTRGHEIPEVLFPSQEFNYEVCDKYTFGNIDWEDFDDVDEIELCGVCTDICVVSNALILKAFYPEMKITVDASCCAGVTPAKHLAALETMKSCQINIIGE